MSLNMLLGVGTVLFYSKPSRLCAQCLRFTMHVQYQHKYNVMWLLPHTLAGTPALQCVLLACLHTAQVICEQYSCMLIYQVFLMVMAMKFQPSWIAPWPSLKIVLDHLTDIENISLPLDCFITPVTAACNYGACGTDHPLLTVELQAWGSLTVTLRVWGSLTVTLRVWGLAYTWVRKCITAEDAHRT